MGDKEKLFLMKLIGGVFIAGIIIFIASILVVELSSGNFSIWILILLVPAILIIAVLMFRIKQQSEGVESGLPMDDELSQRIKERAGYNTYLTTMYFVLGLMWYNLFFVDQFSVPQVPMNYLIFGILFFMFIVFGVNWLIINKKGLL